MSYFTPKGFAKINSEWVRVSETLQRMDLVVMLRKKYDESGIVGKDALIYNLLSYMSEEEIEEFMRKHNIKGEE